MKSKIIFPIILSAMLLTACNPETSLIDDIETSGTSAPAQDIQAVQGEINFNKNEGETNYILGGGTETVVSVTETTEETTPTETLPPKIEYISGDVELDIHKINISDIDSDFSAEFIGGEKLAVSAGVHNISDVPYDIYDIDSGKVILEGFNDTETELGLASKWFDYKFPIDNDRFVYRICGFESMPGFGYYDFTVGRAADFPNSRNFMPIGYHDGKIYAELTAWDGICQGELRTFDIDTLEAKMFMPQNQTSDKFTEYFMSPDGGFIIANDFDGSGINILRIISPDSGENLVKCELNFGGSYGSQFTFIDNNCFAAQNGDSEIIIFNVKM